MIMELADKTTHVMYILNCVYCYGVYNAYKESKHKEIFHEVADTLNVYVEQVAQYLIDCVSMSNHFSAGTALVDESQLSMYSYVCRAGKIFSTAISEFNRVDIYETILSAFMKQQEGSEDIIEDCIKQYIQYDDTCEEPYFDNSCSKLFTRSIVNERSLLATVLSPNNSIANIMFTDIIDTLGLRNKLVNLIIDISPEHSQLISMLEYCGLRVVDVVEGIICQDTYPVSEFIILPVQDQPSKYTLLSLMNSNDMFILSERALMKAIDSGRLNDIKLVNNHPHIDGVTIEKYFGIA